MAVALFCGANIAAELSAENQIRQSILLLPSDYSAGAGSLRPSQQYLSLASQVSNLDLVQTSELRSEALFVTNASGTSSDFTLFGIPTKSIVYSGLTLINGSAALGRNGIYIWNQSPNAVRFHLGQDIPANFTFYSDTQHKREYYTTNLSVAGFVDINQRSVSALINAVLSHTLLPGTSFDGTVALADWNAIFPNLIDFALSKGVVADPFTTQLLVYVQVSPFSTLSLRASEQKAMLLETQIESATSQYEMRVSSQLVSSFQSSENFVRGFRAVFIVAALPELLIAWYLMSSLFSLSMRRTRKETGLHALRGFSIRSIRGMYLFEATLISTLGTIAGVLVGGMLLYSTSPFAVPHLLDVFSWESIAYSTAFGFFSTLYLAQKPINESLRISTTDLLKEEPEQWPVASSRLWWGLAVFGLLELVITVLPTDPNVGVAGGFLSFSFVEAWNLLSLPLMFLGPFFLLLGITGLAVHKGVLARISRTVLEPLMKDTVSIATRPLLRNTKLVFGFAILFGTISAYLVLGSGFVGSQNSFMDRQSKFMAGADISITMAPLQNETLVASHAAAITNQLKSWQGIDHLTTVYTASLVWNTNTVPIKVVDPSSWLQAAYFQPEWFSPQVPKSLFQVMQSDSNSIILSKDFSLGVQNLARSGPIGSRLSVRASFTNQTDKVENLHVVGLVGPLSERPGFQSPDPSWSFVSSSLFGASNPGLNSETVLVKAAQGSQISEIEKRLRSELTGVTVFSASQAKSDLPPDLRTSALNVMFELGLISVVVATFVSIVAFTAETLSQEEHNYHLLTFRGLPALRIAYTILGRFVSIAIFFVPIGAIAGYVALVGGVRILNQNELGFVTLSPVVGFPTLALTAAYIVALFAIITVIIFARIGRITKMNGGSTDGL